MSLEKSLNKIKEELFEEFDFFKEQEDSMQFAINYYFEENPEIKKIYRNYLESCDNEEFKLNAEKDYYEFTEEFLPEYLNQIKKENNFSEVVPGIPF